MCGGKGKRLGVREIQFCAKGMAYGRLISNKIMSGMQFDRIPGDNFLMCGANPLHINRQAR